MQITSEKLSDIRIIRSAARKYGCILNTPKLTNQANILEFVVKENLQGRTPGQREIANHLGLSKPRVHYLLAVMVNEKKLVPNFNGKPVKTVRRSGANYHGYVIGSVGPISQLPLF